MVCPTCRPLRRPLLTCPLPARNVKFRKIKPIIVRHESKVQNLRPHSRPTRALQPYLNSMENPLTWEEFERVQMHVGLVLEASEFEAARKPAYIVIVDFDQK